MALSSIIRAHKRAVASYIGAGVVSGGGTTLPTLGPSVASFAASSVPGTLIAIITGLQSGETIAAVSPNDGRLAIAGGNTLVTGSSASLPTTINATLTTSAGRTLSLGLTVTAAVTNRLAPIRTMVLGDSFGQRAQDVLGAPSRAFSGRTVATASSSPTATGTLIIDGISYALTSGQNAGAVATVINGTGAATIDAAVVGGGSTGALILTAKTRDASFTVSQTLAGLNIATGTYGTAQTDTVNPVSYLWPDLTTVRLGGVAWGAPAWLNAVSGGKYDVDPLINRATGGANSGQWAVYAKDSDRLKQSVAVIREQAAAGRPVSLVVMFCSTNDAATGASFTLAQSYNNILSTAQVLVGEGVKVVWVTASPRGNSLDTTARLVRTGGAGSDDKLAFARALRDKLLADLPNEPSLGGNVRVANGWLHEATAGQNDGTGTTYIDGDILAGWAYDQLHPAPKFARELALAIKAQADLLIPATVTSPLAAATGDTGNLLGTTGLMSGTGGFITMVGNTATNTGFTLDGKTSAAAVASTNVPANWTVATVTGWNGTDPTNVKGTVTVAKETGAVGDKLVITAACNSSGKTNDNTVQIEARTPVTFAGLVDGDWYEAAIMAEVSGMTAFRGVDLELRVTEPDGILRTVRTVQDAPNGTANRNLDPAIEFTGANSMVIRTPPRRFSSGTYGATTIAAMLSFAGQATSTGATVKLSQAAVRKVSFLG